MHTLPKHAPIDPKLVKVAVMHAKRRLEKEFPGRELPQKLSDALSKSEKPIAFERLFPLVDEALEGEKNGVRISSEFQRAFYQVYAWRNIFELFIDLAQDAGENARKGSTEYYHQGHRILLPIFLTEAGAKCEEDILLANFFGGSMGRVDVRALIEFVKKTDFERSSQLFASLYATAFDMHRDFNAFSGSELDGIETKDMFSNPLVNFCEISKAVNAHFQNPPDKEYALNLEGYAAPEQLPLLQDFARIVEERRISTEKP